MNRLMNRSILSTLTLALALAAGSATALAADPADDLKGPAVPERTAPGGAAGFGEKPGDAARRNGEVPLPLPMYLRMLRDVTGPEAAEKLRATDAQREQIEKLSKSHMDAMKAFMEEHRSEIEQIVKEHPQAARMLREYGFGPGRAGERGGDRGGEPGGKRPEGGRGKRPEGGRPEGKGGPEGDPMGGPGEGGPGPGGRRGPGGPGGPGEGPEMNEKDRAAVMAQLNELRNKAPKAEDVKTSIWAVLNADQQQALQTKIDAHKKEVLAERDAKYKEQQKRRFEEGKGTDKAKPAGAKLDDAKRAEVLASLPKEAQDRIGKMPAEQQERILSRLAELPAERRAEALKRLAERRRAGGEGKPGDAPAAK